MTAPPAPLREAHAHLAAHGRQASYLDLAPCTGPADCLDRVARQAAALRARGEPGWLLASSMRIEGWSDPRWPTRAELDRACPDRPCLLGSFDYHSGVVNSPALAAAGFTDASPDPVGGVLARDGSGRPTGLLLESAFNAARRAVPEPTPEQWRRLVTHALDDLAAHGFVEVHDLLSQPWLGPLLADLHDQGRTAVRVWLYPPIDELPAASASAASWQRPGVRLAGGKVFADGTLNARTAWMLEPYTDPIPGHERGTPLVTPASLDDALALTRSLNVGLAVHAIGDAAVHAVLDAAARGRLGPAAWSWDRPPALRIEHAELIDAADIPRFAELGVVCSVQPCHLLYDIEVLRRQLPHRLGRVLPLADLIAAGCAPGEGLWFGSDTPIVRPHPRDSLDAAVHRRRVHPGPAGAPTSDPVAFSQAISEHQAWRAFEAGERVPRTGHPAAHGDTHRKETAPHGSGRDRPTLP